VKAEHFITIEINKPRGGFPDGASSRLSPLTSRLSPLPAILQRGFLDTHCRVARGRHQLASVKVRVVCPMSEHAALVEHKPVLVAPRSGCGPRTLASRLKLTDFIQPEHVSRLRRRHRTWLAQLLLNLILSGTIHCGLEIARFFGDKYRTSDQETREATDDHGNESSHRAPPLFGILQRRTPRLTQEFDA
jgi:hypothetical protein